MSTLTGGADSDLETIRRKVRRVTGRLSSADITDDELNFYINTYLIYDFPEQMRSRILQDNYRFTLNAFQDTYTFPNEQYVLLQSPIFCDGYYLNYYQNQDTFYAAWPKLFFIQQLATGDGTTTDPVLANLSNLPANPNDVLISTTIQGNTVSYVDNGQGSFLSEGVGITNITNAASAVLTLDTAFSGIVVSDSVYISNVYGMVGINGGPYTVSATSGNQVTINVDSTDLGTFESSPESLIQIVAGSVNYQTGAISLDWGSAPDANEPINCHYYTYKSSRPNSVLFFGQDLVFRPIPDQAYLVSMQVYKKPVQLLSNSQSPELRQWWQLIAYGAALKVFADQLDMESYQKCLPLYQEQEVLAMRSTNDQKSQKKVITPFSDCGDPNVWPYDLYGV
jgi:hypothetical protein